MDWTVTGGDILQIIGILGAAWLYVQRIDRKVEVMRAEMKALEKRVDGLERGIGEDIREIKETLRAVFSRLDRKADK